MSKQVRSALVTAMAVVLAGLVLALEWPGLAIAAVVVVLMFLVSILSGKQARAALPARPKAWAMWIGWTEWLWIAVIVAVSAAALYLGVKVGNELDESIAGTAALGAVAGVAFVKLLDQLSSESDWIDDRTEGLAQETFRKAYAPQFDNAQPPGPLPSMRADNPQQESDEYLAVYHDERHGGWGADARKKRAEDMAIYITGHPGMHWV